MATKYSMNRRRFLQSSTALTVAGLSGTLSTIATTTARAEDFPDRPLQVYIPTRAGGGAVVGDDGQANVE